MPIAGRTVKLLPDKLVTISAFSEPTKLDVTHTGGWGPGNAMPPVELHLDGAKCAELDVPGSSVILQGKLFQARAVGGEAFIWVVDASVPPAPVPPPLPPPPEPQPPTPPPSGSPVMTANIIAPRTDVHATGGTHIDVRGIVTIAPDAFLPGTAHLIVKVIDKAGVDTGLGGEAEEEVDSFRKEVSVRTGLVRPSHTISMLLIVTASNGETTTDKHQVQAIR